MIADLFEGGAGDGDADHNDIRIQPTRADRGVAMTQVNDGNSRYGHTLEARGPTDPPGWLYPLPTSLGQG